MRIAIVGAGMAGLACGEVLQGHGHEVALFDKGRRPGGRMSTKTLATARGDVAFDYGAQSMSVRDPAFRARVERWREAGIVAPWPAAGPDAFVGMPGMSAPVIDMAGRQDVGWSSRVTALAREDGRWRLHGVDMACGGFDAAVVAVPAEQVGALVGDHHRGMGSLAAATPSQPCWTVMAAFAEPLPFEADVIGDRGVIAWAARDSAKPGRSGPGRSGPEAWVVQAGPAWSAEHLEEDGRSVVARLLAALGEAIGSGLPAPLATAAHRWRYANAGRTASRYLWDRDLRLGVCGDWLIGPQSEAAWLSGSELGRAMTG